MDQVYATWRLGQDPGMGADGKPHADLTAAEGKTLFETIEQSELPEETTYIIYRSKLCFVILNVFPYTPGHLMVLPKRPIATLVGLTDEEYDEIWRVARSAIKAVKASFEPHGLNIGVNEGTAGGGSIPDHLHIHIVPRWKSDTNFLSTIGEARILPISLAESYDRLKSNWPVVAKGC